MAVYEVSRHGPEIILGFRIIALSPLEEGLEKKVRLILLEKLLVPFLVQDDP